MTNHYVAFIVYIGVLPQLYPTWADGTLHIIATDHFLRNAIQTFFTCTALLFLGGYEILADI